MDENVTISKMYLETLLRRAELVRVSLRGFDRPRSDINDIIQHESENSIKIPLTRYNSLIKDAINLQCLRAALVAGGASEDTLDILISSQQPLIIPFNTDNNESSEIHSRDPSGFQYSKSGLEPSATNGLGQHEEVFGSEFVLRTNMPLTPTSLEHSHEADHAPQLRQNKKLQDAVQADRSLVLAGVPDSVSLFHLTEVIRGGAISNIYIRRRERTAHVSFVNPESAFNFHKRCLSNPLVVKSKVLKVYWDDFQAYVPQHVISRVLNNGVTRNLVVRFVPSGMTADDIREDLDHIHRLEVVAIEFEGGHAWIQLNSIMHAITAKNCMQSRLKYKQSRIEFFTDDCNAALPLINNCNRVRPVKAVMHKPATFLCKNRFDALSTGSSSCEDEGELSCYDD